jgi:hypothetical protein
MDLLKNKHFVNSFCQSDSCKLSCVDYCDDVKYFTSDLDGRSTPMRSCGCKAQRVLDRSRQFVVPPLCSTFEYYNVLSAQHYISRPSRFARCKKLTIRLAFEVVCRTCIDMNLQNRGLVHRGIQRSTGIHPDFSHMATPGPFQKEDFHRDPIRGTCWRGPVSYAVLSKTLGHHVIDMQDLEEHSNELQPGFNYLPRHRNTIIPDVKHPSFNERYAINSLFHNEMKMLKFSNYYTSCYTPNDNLCQLFNFTHFEPVFNWGNLSGDLKLKFDYPIEGEERIWYGEPSHVPFYRAFSASSELNLRLPKCTICNNRLYEIGRVSDCVDCTSENVHHGTYEPELQTLSPIRTVTPNPTFEVGEDQHGNVIYIDVNDIPVSPFLISEDEMPELSDDELMPLYGYY